MSKRRSVIVDFAVYLLVRMVVCAVQALPPGAARSMARCLAWVAVRVDRRHREVARDNLRRAYPGRWDEQQLDGIVRAVYVHFCTVAMEMILCPRKLHPASWRRHVDLNGARDLIDRLLTDRPLLLVTGHFGNWEVAGYVLGRFGFRAHAVARPLDNPFLDRFLERFRESTGQRILAKTGDFNRIRDVLDGGGLLATLADQDAGQRGLFVDFFGRPASTHKAVALLALEHRVPLTVIGCRKVAEPMRDRIEVGEVILPDDYNGDPGAVRDITRRFTASLEQIIRMAPTQYFWLHRRWKHQPTVRASRKAG